LVLEFCEGGELFHYIIEKKYLSEEQSAYIMKQLFLALDYLHSKQISHRDIKPENFMLSKKGDLTCIKMIDFGLSKDFSEQNTMNSMNGSPYYIAPEVFLQKYNMKIDIWSMGVVIYIMLSGKVPFPGHTEPEII
jgi:calcium-dependent protein kinase